MLELKRFVEPVEGKVLMTYDDYEELKDRLAMGQTVYIPENAVIEPTYMTDNAVGADVFASEAIMIDPWDIGTVKTGIKAKFPADEGLFGFIRSSIPKKKGLLLANGTGVIETDYYGNPDNDGEIMLMFLNFSKEPVLISRYERVGQLVLSPVLRFENAGYAGKARGASGSTGQ